MKNMNTTTHNLDVIALRDMMQFKGIDHEMAEAIAIAIDARSRSHDTTGFATKADIKALNSHIDHIYQVITQDIKEAKQSNQSDITLLTQRIDTLPDLIMWKIVKYGSVIYAGIRLVEFILPVLLKGKGV